MIADGDTRLLLSFPGPTPTGEMLDRLTNAPGVTWFGEHNRGGDPREVTERIHAAAGGLPALIAVDQEGGQLATLGTHVTAFPGAMALGAADDPALTERVARAMATEMRGLGFTVNYAPVADLATNPANPAAGIRCFGDDPQRVGTHVAATVTGLQAAGVAAVLKHFPGLGEAADDTHHAAATIDTAPDVLDRRELVPFRAGIAAGAKGVMSAHVAVPGLTGRRDLPATLAPGVLTDLLRGRLGFRGLTITDALDMAALAQRGPEADVDVLAALAAGADLLLTTPRTPSGHLRRLITAALARGLIASAPHAAAHDRVVALRRWLADAPVVEPSGVTGLAAEVARRSITLVRGEPAPIARTAVVTVVEPTPADITPADTTATLAAGGLAAALRGVGVAVRSVVVSADPAPDEITGALEALVGSDAVVVGTADAGAHPGQGELAVAVLAAHPRVTTVSLRVPWDLWHHPQTRSHFATHSMQPVSLAALAAVLVGDAEPTGTMPVQGVS